MKQVSDVVSPRELQSVLAALRSPRRLRTEVLAGLVVALALIPEAISFSIIAGVGGGGEDEVVDGVDGAAPAAPVQPNADGTLPIGSVEHRQRVMVSGRIRALRVQPWSGVPALECTLADDSGGIAVVFLGRREVPGINVGVKLKAQGVIGEHHGQLAMLNPVYEILA